MRNGIIGLVIGVIVGIVLGATVIAPRLNAQKLAAANLLVTPVEERHLPPGTPAPVGPVDVMLRIASAYPTHLTQIGTLATRVDSALRRTSEGGIGFDVQEPGALGGRDELFDAVSSGALDGALASPTLWGHQAPGLQVFGGVPFGPGPTELLAWIDFGGGRALYDQLYAKKNIRAIPCGVGSSEGAGWFKTEIKSLKDIRGLRMAVYGLPAQVLARIGFDVTRLDGENILDAFEKGDIDGAEFSMPAVDFALGLHKVAGYYYFPGWHQPATLFDLMINLKRWTELPMIRRAQIETVCGDAVRRSLAEAEATQFNALKTLQGAGVVIHRWPTDVMEALAATWRKVAREEALADPGFRKAWKSLTLFRRDYEIWKEVGRL